MQSDATFDNHSKLLAAMANEKRLQILKLISEKELGVGELAATVGLTQSALSQHLAKLRAGGLVTTRRVHQNIYYSTNHFGVRRILQLLDEIRGETNIERVPGVPFDAAA